MQPVWRGDWICICQGRAGLYFNIGVVASAAFAIAFLIGFHWGITGMAWAYLICYLTILYPTWAFAARIIDLTFKEAARVLSPVFFCALSMGAVVFGLRWLIPSSMPDWVHLAVEVVAGGLVYFSLVIGFRLKAWEEGRLALGKMLEGKLDTMKGLLLRSRPASLRPAAGKVP